MMVTLALYLAVLMAVHHYMIHPELEGSDRFFQLSDVTNHEVWIVGLLTFTAGVLLQYSSNVDRVV